MTMSSRMHAIGAGISVALHRIGKPKKSYNERVKQNSLLLCLLVVVVVLARLKIFCITFCVSLITTCYVFE